MLTGDNAGTARRIAADRGITSVLSDVLPGQKAVKIKELQATGNLVGMVGDSVNVRAHPRQRGPRHRRRRRRGD